MLMSHLHPWRIQRGNDARGFLLLNAPLESRKPLIKWKLIEYVFLTFISFFMSHIILYILHTSNKVNVSVK